MRVDVVKVDRKSGFLSVADVYKFTYVLAMMGVLFWASSQEITGKEPAVNVPDKLAHFIAYGLLATLVLRTDFFWNKGVKGMFLAVGIASAYGITDEWHQYYVPGRFSDSLDWLADTLGALLASTLYAKWNFYRNLLEWRIFSLKKSKAKTNQDAGSENSEKNESVAG
jgi:VanZ family protein